MIYENYKRNHVILPGREEALELFLTQDYKGMQHKLKNAVSSNSEDALTWSCFDVLANYPSLDKAAALDEVGARDSAYYFKFPSYTKETMVGE